MKAFYRILTIALLFIISFSLCSCSANTIEVNLQQDSGTYIENEDCQNYINETSSFVKVNDGYYFTSNSMLFYYDSTIHQAYPTCDKANCTHEDSNCKAYLSPFKFYPGMSMYYYDNALYLLGHESNGDFSDAVYLYQISLEDFKHRKAAYLFDGTSGISIACTLHRGYIYYSNNVEDMKESTAVLYRVKLGETKSKSAEKVFEFSGIGASIARLSAYGNNVFFNTSSYSDTDGNGYKTILNYVNIHTLENKTIPERKYSHFADDEKVYYCKDENTIAYYDLNTNENKDFCRINGPSYISADSNYIYFDNLQSIIVGKTDEKDRKILVYDKTGNLVTEIEPKGARDNCCFGGDDIMIFESISEGEVVNINGANNYYVFDKSQLTSQDKQFIDMG